MTTLLDIRRQNDTPEVFAQYLAARQAFNSDPSPALVEYHGLYYIHHGALAYFNGFAGDDWRSMLDDFGNDTERWFELPDDWALSAIRVIETY